MAVSSQTYKYPCRPILATQTPVCPPKERIRHGLSRLVSDSYSNVYLFNQCRLIISASVCLPPTFFLAPMQEAARTTAFSCTSTDKMRVAASGQKEAVPISAAKDEFLGLQALFPER